MSMRERTHPYDWSNAAAESPDGEARAAECDCADTIRELLLEIAGMCAAAVLIPLIVALLT